MMKNLMGLVALSSGYDFIGNSPRPNSNSRLAGMPHYDEPKRLSKRRKRRLRGKVK